MRYFTVVAMNRLDWTEAVVALSRDQDDAQHRGRRIATGLKDRFVRCRIWEANLTTAQVEQICECWGRDDFLNGEPLDHALPQPFGAAYERGYRAAKRLARQRGDG
ncbi:MAG: hypothetical protein IT429_14175 [Gemmataceae bacterium]|nr:hypothetical protein [Gemmataceae bacterium]